MSVKLFPKLCRIHWALRLGSNRQVGRSSRSGTSLVPRCARAFMRSSGNPLHVRKSATRHRRPGTAVSQSGNQECRKRLDFFLLLRCTHQSPDGYGVTVKTIRRRKMSTFRNSHFKTSSHHLVQQFIAAGPADSIRSLNALSCSHNLATSLNIITMLKGVATARRCHRHCHPLR